MQSLDYKLDPPEPWQPPEWALNEIYDLEDRNEFINEKLRDYEALVDWYDTLEDDDLIEWYCELIADLEEERYDNQMRIADLSDPKSDIYVSYPEE